MTMAGRDLYAVESRVNTSRWQRSMAFPGAEQITFIKAEAYVFVVGQHQERPPEDYGQRAEYTAWWIVLAALLLILPFYLLFLIRKRQAMSRKIERLQADMQLLFHRAPCGYHSIDERGYFANINDTLLRWMGYERDEIVGKLRMADVIAGGDEIEVQVGAMLRGETTEKLNLDFRKKNGEKFPVVLMAMPPAGVSNHQSNNLFSTIDNSQCKEALDRIRTLDQELESFSYSISHDLRAPLRSIDGYSKILQEDYAPHLGDEGKRVLTVIMNNAKRMGSLIDDLLEFGRLGRKTIQRSYLNMTGIVNSIAHDLLSRQPDRRIHVKVGELHAAFADADMMRQVWINLLDNAFKYTSRSDNAVIEIRSLETASGECRYEVIDNGVGFDMKYAPKLFGVFQRLHKIQDFAGTGVGLAIVKRIISRHGGNVGAEGSLETGAIFYFTIPIGNENT